MSNSIHYPTILFFVDFVRAQRVCWNSINTNGNWEIFVNNSCNLKLTDFLIIFLISSTSLLSSSSVYAYKVYKSIKIFHFLQLYSNIGKSRKKIRYINQQMKRADFSKDKLLLKQKKSDALTRIEFASMKYRLNIKNHQKAIVQYTLTIFCCLEWKYFLYAHHLNGKESGTSEWIFHWISLH